MMADRNDPTPPSPRSPDGDTRPRLPTRGKVLVVDDDPASRSGLANLLRLEGFFVECAADGAEALAYLQKEAPDIILTDVRMPRVDGLTLLREARAACPDVIVVLMTAYAGIDMAIRALEEGASDYLTKPLHLQEVVVILERSLERRRLKREAFELRERLREKLAFENLIGESPSMQNIFRTITQVAPTRAPVLITGERGTGKELLAQAIHENGPRRQAPFVKIHALALDAHVLDRELFGYEKDAFPGAMARREGHVRMAEGGTLYLDEIGEIGAQTQLGLLRLLQERTFERVGSKEPVEADVRVIASTDRDLAAEVAKGRFREDLYYRLNVVTLDVPPLRARPGDLLPLAEHFLKRFAKENKKAAIGFTPSAIAKLRDHRWPGNVSELQNSVERAVVLSDGPLVDAEHLSLGSAQTPAGPVRIPGSTMDEIERHAILSTLEAVDGSTTRAAKMLGISVRKIQYRLHDYGIVTKRN